VLEVIQRSTEFLVRKGVDTPRLQTELLLAHALRLPRMQLYLNFERSLTEPELAQVRELLRRRGQREPLQHIVGTTSFCGLELATNRAALIPRPETELLAEQGWRHLQQLAASPPHAPPFTVLDFGTGSGCLVIAAVSHCPEAQGVALDVSPEALELARQNASTLGLQDRIQFRESAGFAALASQECFDLILSNPPYIPSGEIDQLDPEVRDHDPRLALDGGPDGLDFYRLLAAEAGAFLQPHGRLLLEFGDGQAEPLQRLFESQKWIVERIIEDYTQRPRILAAQWTVY